MDKIKIEKMSFTYPTSRSRALSDISLNIKTGAFTVVCGKSGCGKSTLLRLLKPTIAPHGERSGSIFFDGSDIAALSQREQAREIGFVFQNPDNQIVCDKVWHELAFGLESLSFTKNEMRVRVAEMAAFFGIQDWFLKNVDELSGGQKQLLNLASAMVTQPSVLLLDEPTSRLDPIAADNFLSCVEKVNKEFGTTVIMAEHRLEQIFDRADRLVVMEDGKIAADGTVDEIGFFLHSRGGDMFKVLPTPAKIYCAAGAEGNMPLNVCDGRKWLMNTEHKSAVPADCGSSLPADRETAVMLKAVRFAYKRGEDEVLKGAAMSVKRGELYALLGGNGAGKSTLLAIIMGLKKPSGGKVKLVSERVAMLPQNPEELFVHKTVREELYALADELGKPTVDKAEKMIAELELEELLDRHPYDLSGGEAQRAALALVLMTEPDILLLDEPTKGIDVGFKAHLAQYLTKLKENGMTIIMVSHDIEFCAEYADRCGMLFDGYIVSEDTPRKFFGEKCFYTTAASRMARGIISGAVLERDIIAALS